MLGILVGVLGFLAFEGALQSVLQLARLVDETCNQHIVGLVDTFMVDKEAAFDLVVLREV